MIREFVAHISPGKGRIFALAENSRSLKAVTSLGSSDLEMMDKVVGALNDFLIDRDDASLKFVIDGLPNPVQIAIRAFLQGNCPFELGKFTGYGYNDIVREMVIFGPLDTKYLVQEFEDYLEAAYTVGLGMRVTNEADNGDVRWLVELRTDEVFVPASSEPRTWSLPHGISVLKTWTSRHPTDGPTETAVNVALQASAQGHWVRLHTIAHGLGESELNSGATSEFVVDIFDAPIPEGQKD